MRAAAYSVCVAVLAAGCGAHRRQSVARPGDHGRIQFQNYCAACHQYDGQGMGSAPPLDGMSWVNGPEDRLIRIVLHGVRGSKGEMPGFGQVLSDEHAASLLSFVRERFGPSAPTITPEAVGRVRETYKTRTDYWSVDELLR